MIPTEVKPVKVGILSECIEFVRNELQGKEANKDNPFAYIHAMKGGGVKRICPLYPDLESAAEKRAMYLELALSAIEKRYGKEAANAIREGEQLELTERRKFLCQVTANVYYCTLTFPNKKSLLVANF